MPTVLVIGPYRFFFYSGDRAEPPHVHAERERRTAKFWLEPVELESSRGFSRNEISRIRKLIEQHRGEILRNWHDYFED